jgi:RND family efflux transporter MFP subunit
MRFRYGCFSILLAMMALTFACSRHPAAEDDAASEEAAVAEVTVTRVARGAISDLVTVTGTVAALPNQDVKVSSLVAGRIARLRAAEGDRVSAGQIIAEIEDRPYRDQLQQAEAAVEQAKANLENAELSRTRNEDLFKRGIAARKDLEDARTQVSVQQATLRQAEAQLALAELQITRTEVHSPLNGTVVKRFASDGEQVDGTAAQPIAEVANLDRVELYGNVPAAYLGRIHVGETLPVTTDAAPGKTFDGRIVAVSSAVDPASNLGLVRIRLANPSGVFRLGMFLTAQLAVETHPSALVVPSQAIYRDEKGQPRVFRVQGETAEAAPVTLGLESSQRVEILSGLHEGETIVLTGGYGLADHARVKVQP